MPLRGPEASQRTSFAIFIIAADTCAAMHEPEIISSCANYGGELVDGRTERVARLGLELLGRPVATNYRVGVDDQGAYGGTTNRQVVKAGLGVLDLTERKVELRHPAANLLTERNRRRVLKVGASHLDDVLVLIRLPST